MEAFNNSFTLPYSYTFTSSATNYGIITTTNTNTNIINNNSSSSSSSSCCWMDSRIWSKLPMRLIDRVIAFLPPPAFFRARAVCKRWYALLFSDTFLELYLQLSPTHHWFIFFKHKTLVNNSYIYQNNNNGSNNGNNVEEGYLFDPYNMSWYRLSFPLLPSGFSPASSSGGLICWVSDVAGPKTLILYNPLVGTLTQLPAPTFRPRLFPSIGLAVTPSSIDVSVAGDDMISPYAVKNLTTESFHIDGGGFYSIWGTTCSLPRLVSLESGRMVFVQGRFYCMNYSPFSVLSYDLSSNVWGKIQAPMRRFLRSPSLIESGKKLILVAAVEKSKLNVPKSLRLWCLQHDSGGSTWIEVERMPQQLYMEFEEIENGQGFDCAGHGEFIAIMIRGSNKALLFDFCRKRWQWIPPCPYIHGSNSRNNNGEMQMHGYAYEPRLATPVTGLLDQFTIPFQSFNG